VHAHHHGAAAAAIATTSFIIVIFNLLAEPRASNAVILFKLACILKLNTLKDDDKCGNSYFLGETTWIISVYFEYMSETIMSLNKMCISVEDIHRKKKVQAEQDNITF
jgi:hypothetical protein